MRPLAVALPLLGAATCHTSIVGRGEDSARPMNVAQEQDRIALATPARSGGMSLAEALARRRSVREYANAPISDEALGQLLWAAQGITDPAGYRTAPSAGGLYPLEVYAATERGVFHYEPRRHRLTRVGRADARGAIARAALSQEAVRRAPVLLVIAAVQERTAAKYGARSERYVHLEVGHAAQNVLLTAVALGLGAVPIGAFDDAALERALALPDAERPVYLIAVGQSR